MAKTTIYRKLLWLLLANVAVSTTYPFSFFSRFSHINDTVKQELQGISPYYGFDQLSNGKLAIASTGFELASQRYQQALYGTEDVDKEIAKKIRDVLQRNNVAQWKTIPIKKLKKLPIEEKTENAIHHRAIKPSFDKGTAFDKFNTIYPTNSCIYVDEDAWNNAGDLAQVYIKNAVNHFKNNTYTTLAASSIIFNSLIGSVLPKCYNAVHACTQAGVNVVKNYASSLLPTLSSSSFMQTAQDWTQKLVVAGVATYVTCKAYQGINQGMQALMSSYIDKYSVKPDDHQYQEQLNKLKKSWETLKTENDPGKNIILFLSQLEQSKKELPDRYHPQIDDLIQNVKDWVAGDPKRVL